MSKFKLNSIVLAIASAVSVNAIAQQSNPEDAQDGSIEKLLFKVLNKS